MTYPRCWGSCRLPELCILQRPLPEVRDQVEQTVITDRGLIEVVVLLRQNSLFFITNGPGTGVKADKQTTKQRGSVTPAQVL
jgi:hypothetical protein